MTPIAIWRAMLLASVGVAQRRPIGERACAGAPAGRLAAMHHRQVQRSPGMSRRIVGPAAALVVALVMALAPSAQAGSSLPTPWDGVNPFNCVVQNAGTGTQVPDPGADPYCVSFDKTNQNLTQLGIATFLLNEPTRTAAAVPKCFYFQEDHWRGSVIQSDGATKIYEFEGHYFFNKATGDGGAWITGFAVAGQTFDPTEIPGFPPTDGQYFGPGTGGVITHDDFDAVPQCAALAAKDPAAIYAQSAEPPRCVAGGGALDTHGLGPVALDAGEQVVRAELGAPAAVKRGFLYYCVTGGGELLVGQPGDRSGTFGAGGDAKTVMLATTSPGVGLIGRREREIHVADPTRTLRAAFPHARTLGRVGPLELWRVSGRIVVLSRGGHVRYLAIHDPKSIRTNGALAGYLRRASAG
jgi:hypothetical protein